MAASIFRMMEASPRVMTSARIAFLIMILVGGRAGAQQAPASMLPPCDLDTAAYTRVLNITVWLDTGVEPTDASDRAVAARALVAAVVQEFHPPATRFSKGRVGLDPSSFYGTQLLTGEVVVEMAVDRSTVHHWKVVPGWSALQAGLDSAITSAGTSREYLDAIAGLYPQPHTLDLQVRASGEPPDGQGLPLLRIRTPYLVLTTPATRLKGPDPRFPASAAQKGMSGYVDFEYLINEDGRVDSASVHPLKVSDAVFLPPARETILNSQYRPARVTGCPVPQLVRQRISFRAPR